MLAYAKIWVEHILDKIWNKIVVQTVSQYFVIFECGRCPFLLLNPRLAP